MKIAKHNIVLLAMLLAAVSASAQYASHSVLRQGEWWKAAIAETGLYRLTTAELPGLDGVSVDSIALYGHPGGELSVTNGDSRIDDLEEMAIAVVDNNGDKRFDAGDYIIFYATNADRWQYSAAESRIIHSRHHFSAYNYVYITHNSGTHKRIATRDIAQASGDAVTTCHYVDVHDNDLTNTHKSGQIWVGEHFSGGASSQQFTLQLPATPVGDINVRLGLASVSKSASSFNVVFNGTSRTYHFSGNTCNINILETFPRPTSARLDFTLQYNYNENLAVGYLDYIEVDATAPMTFSNSMPFMHLPPSGGVVQRYTVGGAPQGARVWDVTDYNNVVEIASELSGSTLTFNDSSSAWKSYCAFSGSHSFKTPASIQRLDCQDIHSATSVDMVIVCAPALREHAERLAAIHSIHDDINTLVVTQDEVFNEFSGGQTDPIAIREMLRMLRSSGSNSLRHLLLFGKGTYDNRNILGRDNTTVVTYQSLRSFDDEGESMSTDDILAYLDDGEKLSNTATMDISVGRLPAKNGDEARHLVDKIERYITRYDLLQDGIRGDWRNSVALLADDADPSCGADTSFTWSSEVTARQITARYPQLTIDKIYADAYVQRTGADGSFYPDANNALKKRINYGCLLLNYIGHGSSQYIGTERYMMKSDISNYTNYYQLPFFVTSTCTFGRHDDPDETCGAEEFLLADGAGVACLAATRPIAHVQVVNTDMVMQALDPANTIGDAVRIAKNHRPTTQALTLLGDPALRLSHPQHTVVVTAINGRAVDSLRSDTALVLSTVTVEGEIRDSHGDLVDDFDGDIYPEVFDSPKNALTLSNDNDDHAVSYTQQNSIIYKGHAAVAGGRFTYRFTIPRDVSYKYDKIRITHYAKSSSDDAAGAYLNLYAGGFDESVDLRETRPDIRLFINDTNFRDGGITDANPTLLALLYDSVGINAVGSGLGHDIAAVLDGNANNVIILNDLFETDIDDEHLGSISYTFSNLDPGEHTLTLKAWNIFNFSNSATITFHVHSADTATTRATASPCPAADHVTLRLEHNCGAAIASAVLDIYDMQGRHIRGYHPEASAASYVVGPVVWDLRHANGTRVPQGIYIARFTITTADGDRMTESVKIAVR